MKSKMTEQQKNKKIIDDWLRESQEQGPLSSDDLFRMNAEQQRKMRNPQPVKNTPYPAKSPVQPSQDVNQMTQAQRNKLIDDWMKADLSEISAPQPQELYKPQPVENTPYTRQPMAPRTLDVNQMTQAQRNKIIDDWMNADLSKISAPQPMVRQAQNWDSEQPQLFIHQLEKEPAQFTGYDLKNEVPSDSIELKSSPVNGLYKDISKAVQNKDENEIGFKFGGGKANQGGGLGRKNVIQEIVPPEPTAEPEPEMLEGWTAPDGPAKTSGYGDQGLPNPVPAGLDVNFGKTTFLRRPKFIDPEEIKEKDIDLSDQYNILRDENVMVDGNNMIRIPRDPENPKEEDAYFAIALPTAARNYAFEQMPIELPKDLKGNPDGVAGYVFKIGLTGNTPDHLDYLLNL